MTSNKPSVEELLQIAGKYIPLVKDLPSGYTHAQKFSLLNDIKSSEVNRVPAFLIYELYHEWAIVNMLKPLSNIAFFKEFATLFNKIKSNGQVAYLVTGEKMDVSLYTSTERQLMKTIYSKRNLNGKTKKDTKKVRSDD